MSDTPETDAFQQTDQCAYDSMWRGFARKLERERDMLKKHISIMDISHKTANDEYFKLAVENEKLERERDEAIQARKVSAADWLNQIANADLRVTRIKRERDLWKTESERWREIKK